MASDMDKIMDMSLDEYIAKKKTFGTSGAAAAGSDSNLNESKFKAERRRQKRPEEAEDDDDDLISNMKDDAQELGESRTDVNSSKSFGIWRGPSMSTNYLDLEYMKDEFDNMFNDPDLQAQRVPKANQLQRQQQNIDLRNKISSNNGCGAHANGSSQQWRLARPPVVATSSTTLLNNHADFSPNNSLVDEQNRRRWNRRPRRRNGNGGNNFCGGGMGNGIGAVGNGNWSNNRNNNGYMHYNNNNGRIQRINQQRNNQEMLNKNIKAVLDRINSNNFITNRQSGSVRDLTIECPSAAISLSTDPIPTQQGHLQQQQHMIQSASLSQPEPQINQGLKALLGVSDNSFKTEMMPMLASKFLDFLQNGAQQTMHKPIYDMQIQKEIHELQKKPLLYKCPGGEVVSSDGAGIESCQVIPRTSGVTLNYRFG